MAGGWVTRGQTVESVWINQLKFSWIDWDWIELIGFGNMLNGWPRGRGQQGQRLKFIQFNRLKFTWINGELNRDNWVEGNVNHVAGGQRGHVIIKAESIQIETV